MNRPWVARVRSLAHGLGWPGIAGLALGVFGIGHYALFAVPARAELSEARATAAALQERFRMSGGRESAAAPTVEQQLAAFYGFFPAPPSAPEWLGRIHAAAESNKLILESGEYKTLREKGGRLTRYQIALPVKGSYSQIRGFIAEVLDAVPAAVLEDLSLKRENTGSAVLEARVRLTLYLGGG